MKKYALAAALALSTLGVGTASNAAVVMVDSRSETPQVLALANGLYNITVSGRVFFQVPSNASANNGRLADADFGQQNANGVFTDSVNGFDIGLEIDGSLSPWDVFAAPRADSIYTILYTVTTGSISFLFRDREGRYGDNEGSLRVEISAVPLPASALGLLAGLAGLGFLRRRKTA